jgi:hypothetical protein
MKTVTMRIYFWGAVMVFFAALLLCSCAYKAQDVGGTRKYYDRDSTGDLLAKKLDKPKESVSDEEYPREPEAEREEEKPKERLVIYVAEYSLHVESVRQAMREFTTLVARFNGFIESAVTSDSYRYAKVVLRVPVKNFEDTLKEIERMGTVTEREVTASDVTMEYSDISLRLESAKKVRQRLYNLLKRVKKVKERVKILREIERLTTIIDSLSSRMKYLDNRARYSTIVIHLRAKVKDVVRQFIPSPFPWIAALDPSRRSIFDDGGDLSFEKPVGFFFLEKEFYREKSSAFLFITPDQSTGIRIGIVENYPPADLKFWHEAFAIDLQNRMYKVLAADELSGKHRLKFKRYVVQLSSGERSVVAFAVSGDRIIVIEARFAGEKNYASYKGVLEKFIMSTELKK